MSWHRAGVNPLVSIQILRALAALSVAYGHAAHEAGMLAARKGTTFSAPLQGLSPAGVDLFFAISGFVMVISSTRFFGDIGGSLVFLRRRLARIVPIYWVATTLFLIALWFVPGALNADPPTWPEIIKSYLFFPFARDPGIPIQPVYSLGWTLNYEMFFYVLFALFLPLPARIALPLVVGTLAAIVLAGRYIGASEGPYRFWSDPIVFEFAFGVVIGGLYLAGLRWSVRIGMVVMGAGALVFALANASGVLPIHWERLAWIGLPLAVVLAGSALMRSPAAGGAWRPLAILGDASYALYLFHPIVIRGLSIVWGKLSLPMGAGLAGWGFVGMALLSSCLAALVIYRQFERPLTRLLQGATHHC